MSKHCKKHNTDYEDTCPVCSLLQSRKRRVNRIESELQRQQAEEAEKARIERETPPCQLGQRCEWATHTGVNITCSRLIAGCVKLEAKA